ncbi:5-enolpyruvylshikimate-3-phosphate synthase [Nakamurella sp. UYEF19]|uniref:hypothetical protein n=1 Tax=Nakamurella sp. UYEF19 TaxID=1756392 RepID=UPI0033927931
MTALPPAEASESWLAPVATIPVRGRVTVPAFLGRPSAGRVDPADAVVFLAAAAVTTGTVLVRNWPGVVCGTDPVSVTADLARTSLAAMGAYLVRTEEGLTCTSRASSGELTGLEVDLTNGPGLGPTFAVLAALSRTPSVLRGLPTALGERLCTNLLALGGRAVWDRGVLQIDPGELRAGVWRSSGDHRMATAAAVIGLRVDGVLIDDIACLRRDLPRFLDAWTYLMAQDAHLLPGTTESASSANP